MLYVNTFEKIYENTYFVINFLKLKFAKILKTQKDSESRKVSTELSREQEYLLLPIYICSDC